MNTTFVKEGIFAEHRRRSRCGNIKKARRCNAAELSCSDAILVAAVSATIFATRAVVVGASAIAAAIV
jgi:hypothetical protein